MDNSLEIGKTTNENQVTDSSSSLESSEERPKQGDTQRGETHHSTHMNRNRQQLRIIQYNVQKSYPVMNTLLKDPRVLDYTVICIQEPWLNGRNSKQTQPYAGQLQCIYGRGNRTTIRSLLRLPTHLHLP